MTRSIWVVRLPNTSGNVDFLSESHLRDKLHSLSIGVSPAVGVLVDPWRWVYGGRGGEAAAGIQFHLEVKVY